MTLGTVWSGGWELDNAVEAYNARNGKYYVEVVDYFPEDFEGVANDVYDAALDRLRMDLATGKDQDIIEFQYGLVPDELGYAGVLADLNTFISPKEREEIYLSNILDCAQTGDALYEIAPVFEVSGMIGDGAKLEMETGWTVEEMLAVFKKYGKDANAWGNQGVYTAETLVEHAIEDFVDWETGEADFCKQEFYDILEFAKDESGYVRVTRESVSSGTHLICVGGSDVTDTQRMDWLFGDNVVMKGWPCSQGTGVSVSFDISVRLGISAYSQCKEGAWDFIRYYVGLDWMEEWVSLHPDYLGSKTPANLPGLPINRKRFEEIGLIIENPGFLSGYTGYKNLEFLAGIRRVIGKKEIRDSMERVGLDPDCRKKVGKYSLGMKQRLAIAQAIIEDPPILILDEPMNVWMTKVWRTPGKCCFN